MCQERGSYPFHAPYNQRSTADELGEHPRRHVRLVDFPDALPSGTVTVRSATTFSLIATCANDVCDHISITHDHMISHASVILYIDLQLCSHLSSHVQTMYATTPASYTITFNHTRVSYETSICNYVLTHRHMRKRCMRPHQHHTRSHEITRECHRRHRPT